MAELVSALLCDYVRQEGAVVHVIGGNIDTFYVADVPAGANVGILLVFQLTRAEADRTHQTKITIGHADSRIAELTIDFSATWDESLPDDWQSSSPVSMNFGLPLPALGVYSFDISLDGDHQRTLYARAVQQQ